LHSVSRISISKYCTVSVQRRQFLCHQTALKIEAWYHQCHFWQAPLGERSTKCRHQSPEWTILSHINCFIQGQVIGFQVLIYSLHPRSIRKSCWSPPVVWGGGVVKTLGTCFIWHSRIVAEQRNAVLRQ